MLVKIRNFLFFSIGLFVLFIIGFIVYAHIFFRLEPPVVLENQLYSDQELKRGKNNFASIHNNWIKQNKYGIWEMYAEGKPYELGYYQGVLSEKLIHQQEEYFVAQIKEMIPSDIYLNFLRYFIGFFNRKIDSFILTEYKKEIYGISRNGSDNFDFIGTPYERLMNYHAAHDIGHALANLSLVACTSFALKDEKSKEESLIIGRNFDFYVGDDFSKNKIIAFINPEKGYKFASITWGGFIGVVSGMNEKGLTVTMNAGDTDIPSSSATPISILAREILQYASTTQEALEIAKKRETFVSEALMIGSASEENVMIIEKYPKRLSTRAMDSSSHIICTNHFFSGDRAKGTDATHYRYEVLESKIKATDSLSYLDVAKLLRDQKGKNNEAIGFGNEKSINQLIAHHSIIFKPKKRQLWLSTSPYQLGEYICYDLNRIFNQKLVVTDSTSLYQEELTIPADSFLYSKNYNKFLFYKDNKKSIKKWTSKMKPLDTELLNTFESSNPDYYETYNILGDYFLKLKENEKAKKLYKEALGKEIANQSERIKIQNKINEL